MSWFRFEAILFACFRRADSFRLPIVREEPLRLKPAMCLPDEVHETRVSCPSYNFHGSLS
jgi:hypothetical protein